jgi:hypothetical protein
MGGKMTLTLHDFGYKLDRGAFAVGERPLLIVLATVSGTPWLKGAGKRQYYQDLIFGNSPFLYDHDGNTIKSMKAFYSEMSHGRFTWKPTSPSVVEITLTPQEASLQLPARRNKILERLHNEGLFDFMQCIQFGFAVDELHLGVLVVDNASPIGAPAPGAQTGLGYFQWEQITLMPQVSVVDQQVSFATIAHELCHGMATEGNYPPPSGLSPLARDLYGPDSRANLQMTLMNNAADPNKITTPQDLWHLDPWHKLIFGWIEPRILNINELVSPINLAGIGSMDPTGSVILYDSTRGPNEYFFLEYRTQSQKGSGAFDREVNSEGLAIWHILTGANNRPQIIVWPPNQPPSPPPPTTFPTFYLEGMPQPNLPSAPPGPAGFTRAGKVAWKQGTVTPTLRWWDNSTTNLKLAVRWYPVDALNILVDAYPVRLNLPTSSQLVSPGSGSYQMFWAGKLGDLLVSTLDVFEQRQWTPPAPLTSRGTLFGGTEPTALARANGQVDVFWVGADQAIWWMTKPSGRERSAPQQITPPAVANKSSRIRAVSRNVDHLDVFWADAHGTLYYTWMDNNVEGGTWTNHLFEVASSGSVKSPWSVSAVALGPEWLSIFWLGGNASIQQREWRPDPGGRNSKWQAVISLNVPATSIRGDTAIVGFCQDFNTFDVFWVDQTGDLRHGAQTPASAWSEQAATQSANVAKGSDLALCYVSGSELALCYGHNSGAMQAAIYTNSGIGWRFARFEALPQTSGPKALPKYQLAAANQDFGHADIAFVQDDLSLHHVFRDRQEFRRLLRTISRSNNQNWQIATIASAGLVRSKT